MIVQPLFTNSTSVRRKFSENFFGLKLLRSKSFPPTTTATKSGLWIRILGNWISRTSADRAPGRAALIKISGSWNDLAK